MSSVKKVFFKFRSKYKKNVLESLFLDSRVIKILGWYPVGPVVPHEEKVHL